MYSVTSHGKKYIIPFYSSTLDDIKNHYNENIDIPLDNFSTICLDQLINIKQQKSLQPETFDLIDFLDLIYLLYNCDIPINTHNQYIIELYDIKTKEPNEQLHRLINFFGDKIKYINFDYNKIDIYSACKNGYTNILNCKIKIMVGNNDYIHLMINTACKYGQTNVLNFIINNNITLDYTSNDIDNACKNGRTNILEWFYKNKLEIKHTKNAIDWACEYGHINVLTWFYDHGFKIEPTSNAFSKAFINNHTDILE